MERLVNYHRNVGSETETVVDVIVVTIPVDVVMMLLVRGALL